MYQFYHNIIVVLGHFVKWWIYSDFDIPHSFSTQRLLAEYSMLKDIDKIWCNR